MVQYLFKAARPGKRQPGPAKAARPGKRRPGIEYQAQKTIEREHTHES